MRIKVPKPRRTFLEMDELVALTDAAAEQDAERRPRAAAGHPQARHDGGQRRRALGRRHARDPHRRRPRHLTRHGHLSPAAHALRGSRASTKVGARSSRRSAAQGSGSASCATSVSATSAYTRPAGPTSGFQTPRPKPASARSRSAPTCSRRSSPTSTALRRVGLPTDGEAYLFCNRRGGRLQRQKRQQDRRRGGRARVHPLGRSRTSAAPEHHAAHPASDLHLHCAAGEPLRRPLGDAPGRARRLEDDDGRLRPAAAARGAFSTARRSTRSCARRGSGCTGLWRTPTPRATEAGSARERTLEDLVDEWRDGPNGD